MGWVERIGNFLETVSKPFNPWIVWKMDAVKFPINSYEIFFISMALSVSTYILGSYLTYKPYNLDKLLHRGKYSDCEVVPPEKLTFRNIIKKLIGITPEYSRLDRGVAWFIFYFSFVYKLCFMVLGAVIWNAISPWPIKWWSNYFFISYLLVPILLGITITVWFTAGGTRDVFRLFRDLAKRTTDARDNGQVFHDNSDQKP